MSGAERRRVADVRHSCKSLLSYRPSASRQCASLVLLCLAILGCGRDAAEIVGPAGGVAGVYAFQDTGANGPYVFFGSLTLRVAEPTSRDSVTQRQRWLLVGHASYKGCLPGPTCDPLRDEFVQGGPGVDRSFVDESGHLELCTLHFCLAGQLTGRDLVGTFPYFEGGRYGTNGNFAVRRLPLLVP